MHQTPCYLICRHGGLFEVTLDSRRQCSKLVGFQCRFVFQEGEHISLTVDCEWSSAVFLELSTSSSSGFIVMPGIVRLTWRRLHNVKRYAPHVCQIVLRTFLWYAHITIAWSWRFLPTPGRSLTTGIPCLLNWLESPIPESIRSFGESSAPAQTITSFDALTVGC